MHNFRHTTGKLDCIHCKHFSSYKDIYEDELEPDELGTCPHINDMVGEELICDLFTTT